MRFVKGVPGIQILTRKPRNQLPFQLVVGQVQETVDEHTRKVKVLQMEMNDYLKMYFNKSYLFDSMDHGVGSKKGDIVLVKKLKNPPSQNKLFGIEKILFKVDGIVDPITGKSNTNEIDILDKHLKSLEIEK